MLLFLCIASNSDGEKTNKQGNQETDETLKNFGANGMKNVESEENNNNIDNNKINYKRGIKLFLYSLISKIGLSIDYEAEMKRIEDLRKKNEMQRNMIRKNTSENLKSIKLIYLIIHAIIVF